MTKEACQRPGLQLPRALAIFGRPVSLARSGAGAGDIDLDCNFAEFPVLFGIAGNVADAVEAAHFLRDLGEDAAQIE